MCVVVIIAILAVLSIWRTAYADGSTITNPPVPQPPSPGTGYGEGGMPYNDNSGYRCRMMPGMGGGGLEGGAFNYTNGHVNGGYVEFDLNEATGTITNYTIKTVIVEWPGYNGTEIQKSSDGGVVNSTEPRPPVGDEQPIPPGPTPSPPDVTEPLITYKNITAFKSITIDQFKSLQKPTVLGGIFLFHAEEVFTMAYDTSFANLYYFATSDAISCNNMTFHLGEGINATVGGIGYVGSDGIKENYRDNSNNTNPDPNPVPPIDQNMAWLNGDNLIGTIYVSGGNLSVTDGLVTVALGDHGFVSFYAFTIIPLFMETLGPEVKDNTLSDMKDAIASGRVGAEIKFGPNGGSQGGSRETGTSYNTVRYDTSLELRPLSYGKDKVELEVSSTVSSGRVFLINIDNSVMDSSVVEDLVVKMDGIPMEVAPDVNTVFSASGSTAQANIVTSTTGLSVAVYVPHFSAHTITVEKISSLDHWTIVLPITLGITVTVAAFILLALKKKK